jgi:predicted aspartyl protease
MLTRRNMAAGLGLSWMAGKAFSQTPSAPAPPPGVSDPNLALQDAPILLDAGLDDADRMTIEVMVNGQGPFDFVVDTGADRSVISEELADRLLLPRGPDVIVHGVGGFRTAPTAAVGRVSAGETVLKDGVLPLLPFGSLRADGLLGVDILEGQNVVMDFKRKRLSIKRSEGSLGSRGIDYRNPRDIAVSADSRFGRLTIVDARIAGVRCQAFIDSGAGGSIGNGALARAVNLRLSKSAPAMPVRLLGAAGDLTPGEFRVVRKVQMGAVRIDNLPLIFADLHIFNFWNLNDRPAVLIGADVLKLFAKVELDFGGKNVRFRLGQGLDAPVRSA